jgi:hypothetical protein
MPSGIATTAAVVGTIAVLAVLAAVALYPDHQNGPPHSSHSVASSATSSTTTSTTTTVPLPPISSVTVQVLNASGSGQLAAQAAARLKALGFGVSGTGNAPSQIAAGQPSEIFYGPSGLPAAQALAAWVNGPFTNVPRPSLADENLVLWIANPQFTIKGFPPKPATTTTSAAP